MAAATIGRTARALDRCGRTAHAIAGLRAKEGTRQAETFRLRRDRARLLGAAVANDRIFAAERLVSTGGPHVEAAPRIQAAKARHVFAAAVGAAGAKFGGRANGRQIGAVGPFGGHTTAGGAVFLGFQATGSGLTASGQLGVSAQRGAAHGI